MVSYGAAVCVSFSSRLEPKGRDSVVCLPRTDTDVLLTAWRRKDRGRGLFARIRRRSVRRRFQCRKGNRFPREYFKFVRVFADFQRLPCRDVGKPLSSSAGRPVDFEQLDLACATQADSAYWFGDVRSRRDPKIMKTEAGSG